MKALVTGGGGFLGGAIATRLRARGDEVRSFSRGKYADLESLGVEHIQGDLADSKAVSEAVRGVEAVFHVGAKAGVWGPYADYFVTNVTGTENVITACRREGVRKLVFTSTPSVVFGARDLEGVDESIPYASRYETAYPETKARAERKVLQSNGPELLTVALRPHLIWGPGDNQLVPRIVARGRAGKLRRIGRRPCIVDSVYIDNAADAHILAAEKLTPGAACAGKPYFISNDEPMPVFDLINKILAAAGVPPVTRSVPVPVAVAAGWMMETVYRLLSITEEPPMTRFVAHQLATSHWFDISAARRDLGYVPSVKIEEGLDRLKRSFRP
jgi:nucleoside-diphosphate-sugar epimerase